MKNFVQTFFIAVVVLAIAGCAYWFGAKKGNPFVKSSPMPATVVSELEGTTASQLVEESEQLINPSVTIAAIEEDINGKSYLQLEPYLADSVNVGIWATECCGILSKAKAIEQLKYLNSATQPWDFTATSAVAKSLEAKNPENFKDAIIGIAANKYAVAFQLNDQFLISKIFLVVDYSLITSQ